MAKRPYEISLWSHNDKFLSILTSSDAPSLGSAYDPHWYDGINGEKKLTFTIPIKYFDPQTNEFVNNEKWYNELKQSHTLANEKKVKLIFDKLKTDPISGDYIHDIYEFVIEEMVEERNENELLCKVTCLGAAFKELGKTGTELVLNFDTMILEEEKSDIQLQPTINYWLSKVFPSETYSIMPQWTYRVNVTNSLDMPNTKIYEVNPIDNWVKVGDALQPVFAPAPIEKERFIDVKQSNRYNITQDLAETFQVFVDYVYYYEDPDQPFKITKKEVVFYDVPQIAGEYSIVYGNNELGLSRTSSSADVTTKMFVEDIQSEYSDDGFVSITRASGNKLKDNFILNFDYFIQSGQMSDGQAALIPTFEEELREVNQEIEDQASALASLQYNISMLEADVSNYENSVNSANENIIEIEDKLLAFSEALDTYIVEDKDVLNTVKLNGAVLSLNFRRRGVMPEGLVVKTTAGAPIAVTSDNFIYDNYGYVTTIIFPVELGITSGTVVKLTYDYDLLSFYRNERETYLAIKESSNNRLLQKQALLDVANQEETVQEAQLENASNRKRIIVETFNQKMAPYLKEGTWNESDYQPSFELRSVSVVPLTYDPRALNGEPTSYYMEGLTKKYYDYIILPSGVSADAIEQFVITESFTEQNGKDVIRELRYGAQYVPHFIYTKEVFEDSYETLAQLTLDNPSNTLAYFVKENGVVYHKPSTAWVALQPIVALVMDSNINVRETGHVFSVDGVQIALNQRITGTPYSIAQRRWFLTEDGQPTSTPLRNFQTSTLKLRRTAMELTEFNDYNVTHDGVVKSITIKINNKATYSTLEFNADYKLDVSSEQLLRDAQSVSKTSAFPEVSYEVTFAYLNEAIAGMSPTDVNLDKRIEVGSIVRITDYDLQIKGVKGIVSSVDRNLDRPEETIFTIQNYKTKFEDLFERIIASSEQMKSSGYLYDRITGVFGPNLTISGSVLQQSIDETALVMRFGTNNSVSFGGQGILTETLQPYPNGVTGQTLIVGGSILLSNSLNADGQRIWSSALTPLGINANLIRSGRIDTELVNIYSGGQIRFSWKADGLFAYRDDQNNTYVRYNEDGLLFWENGVRAVELGWNGLYIGSQNGSVELTGTGGLEIYNAQEPRELLVKLGGFGIPNIDGIYPEYGMRLYKNRDGQLIETLVASNDGQLWLRDSLLVGTGTGMVGLTAENPVGVSDPIRIWAGNPLPELAPFSVTDGGFVKATSGIIGGFSLTDKKLYYGTGALDYVGLGQDGNYRIWAGAVSQASAPFSITNAGHLTATSGAINGPFTVGGYLSSTYFASGAFGNGWRISGSGSAEFNDVYVRGTIAASVFEYQTINSVGGSLYVAPAIISIINSNQIAIAINKYVVTIPENFTNPQRGGHTWVVGDYVSLSGFIVKNNTSYELKDIRARVGSISGSGISLITLSDVGDIVCYDENDNTVNYASLSMAGAILMKRATIVLLGTYQDETAYNRGILINAVGNDTPFIDVYDDQNSTSGNPKVRLGNLGGIIDPNFGPGALSGYGLYAENAYLTGKIVATSGYIGGPNGWTITEGAMYSGGRSSILQNITGMYFGSDGFGLGGGLLYETEGNKLTISGDSIVMGIGLINEKPLVEYIDEQLGYRLEVLSTSNILSSDITEITIYTRVYKGQVDVTEDLPDSVFHWTRVSNDAFADGIWNNNPANQGRKTFTLSTLDVYYSATFTCSIIE